MLVEEKKRKRENGRKREQRMKEKRRDVVSTENKDGLPGISVGDEERMVPVDRALQLLQAVKFLMMIADDKIQGRCC